MIREFSNRRIERQFRRGNLRGAADLGMNHTARAIRRDMRLRGETDAGAVAFHGVKCYTSNRCAAMGGKIPATKQDNGTKNHFPVRITPYASRIVSYRCAGGDFRKRR